MRPRDSAETARRLLVGLMSLPCAGRVGIRVRQKCFSPPCPYILRHTALTATSVMPVTRKGQNDTCVLCARRQKVTRLSDWKQSMAFQRGGDWAPGSPAGYSHHRKQTPFFPQRKHSGFQHWGRRLCDRLSTKGLGGVLFPLFNVYGPLHFFLCILTGSEHR